MHFLYQSLLLKLRSIYRKSIVHFLYLFILLSYHRHQHYFCRHKFISISRQIRLYEKIEILNCKCAIIKWIYEGTKWQFEINQNIYRDTIVGKHFISIIRPNILMFLFLFHFDFFIMLSLSVVKFIRYEVICRDTIVG